MFGLGGGELLLIVLIALVLFGKEDLPKTLRKFTKGFNEFKKVTNDAQRSWHEMRDDVTRSLLIEDLEQTNPDNSKHTSLEESAPEIPVETQTDEAPKSQPTVRIPVEAVARGQDLETPNVELPTNASHLSEDTLAEHHDHHAKRGDEPQTLAADPTKLQKPS